MKFIRIAAISGALAVIIGAFGAHTLKIHLLPEQLNSFETGVKYQFYHTIALLICGMLYRTTPSPKLKIAASSFIAGMIMFCGSIYLLSTRTLTGFENISWLGPVTPIGGILFILGWVFLFLWSGEKSNGK